jgi:hypothetical protein
MVAFAALLALSVIVGHGLRHQLEAVLYLAITSGFAIVAYRTERTWLGWTLLWVGWLPIAYAFWAFSNV